MQGSGMPYEDVRRRVKRIEREANNPQMKANLQASLINQARLREGEGAAKELSRELQAMRKR